MLREHLALQRLRVGCAAAVVDVGTGRRDAERDHVGAELVEDVRCSVISGAVGAVDDDAHAAQVERARKAALAELDVPARRVFDAAGAAEFRRRHAAERLAELRLDRCLDVVGQLVAVGREELDAVVLVRIVRRADDDARLQPQRARQVGDRRRGDRSRTQHVHAGGREACLQCGFEHVARYARVLADDHRGARARTGKLGGAGDRRAFGAGEHLAGRIAEAQDEIGRDRRFADAAPNAVGAEILACHRVLLLRSVRSERSRYSASSIARQTRSASQLSATSCTRTMRAPRITAASIADRLPASR